MSKSGGKQYERQPAPEPELFGVLASEVAGKSEAELAALADRLAAHAAAK